MKFVVRLSIILSVIGEDAVKAFDTFVWSENQKEDTAKDVAKFAEYCEPRTQIIQERFSMIVNKREVNV